MAQLIELPLTVEFTPEKRVWEMCTATLIPPLEAAPKPVSEFPALVASFETAEISLVRSSLTGWNRIFAEINQRYRLGGFANRTDPLMNYFRGQGVMFNAIYATNPSIELFASFEAISKKVRPANPWTMRDEFIALPRKMTALGKFLNRWGVWDGVGIRKVSEQSRLLGLVAPSTQYVVPHVIWELQTKFRAALSGDAEEWLAQHGRIPAPQREANAPHFTIKQSQCLAAIETTITLDKIRDVPYRVCERVDCGMVFKLESKHLRRFCTQYCAHLVSVRKQREAKRNNRKEGKS